MGWLARFLRNRAAKTYARRLPPILRAGYGSSQLYTPGQVKAALALARLGGAHVAIAYAGLLSAEDYAAHQGELPTALNYDLGRRLFERHRLPNLPQSPSQAGLSAYIDSGGGGDFSIGGHGGDGGGGH